MTIDVNLGSVPNDVEKGIEKKLPGQPLEKKNIYRACIEETYVLSTSIMPT